MSDNHTPRSDLRRARHMSDHHTPHSDRGITSDNHTPPRSDRKLTDIDEAAP